MAKKKKIEVQGNTIQLEDDYISLTDIAQDNSQEAKFLIRNWMNNINSLKFLWTWEKLYNPNFKGVQLNTFLGDAAMNRYSITPKKWIDEYHAIGFRSKAGRGGGTYAHQEIALEFCTWLSPEFKVYVLREFRRLKEEEAKRLDFEWHIQKITNNIDEVRNLLDTIPGQLPNLQRLKKEGEDEF